MSTQYNSTLTSCQVDRKEANVINSRVENCGNCCLIHQQFTITENTTITGSTRIYLAPDLLFAPESPFGTVTVSNCGSTPLTVVFRTASATNGIVVPPGGQFAITGSIKQIDIAPLTATPTQICAVFHFDLFLILPQCSASDNDDVDVTIDNNIGNTSSSSQSSSASSSLSASASSTSGNNSIAGNINTSALNGGSNSTTQTATATS